MTIFSGTYGAGRAAMISSFAQIYGAGKVALVGDGFIESLGVTWDKLNGSQFANLGFGGAKVADLVSIMPSVLPSVIPSRAIVMIGYADTFDPSFDSGDFQDNYTALINQLKAYTNFIYLALIPPPTNQGSPPPDLNRIDAVNTLIAQVANAQSVTTIDTYSPWVNGNVDSGYAIPGFTINNGVYPTPTGAAALLPAFSAAAGASPATTTWNLTGETWHVVDAVSDVYLTYAGGAFYMVNNRNSSPIRVYTSTYGATFRGSQTVDAGKTAVFATALPADSLFRRFAME